MKPITRRILMALAAVGLATGVAACGHHRHDPQQQAERIMEKVSEELDLTQEQQAKLEAVKDEFISAGKEMRKERKQAREEAMSLLEQPKLDRAKAQDLVNQRLDAIRAHSPQVINALGDFYDSLTPEQQKELRERIQDKMEHFESRYKD
jgi:periplasmic protein CpxP/Spy